MGAAGAGAAGVAIGTVAGGPVGGVVTARVNPLFERPAERVLVPVLELDGKLVIVTES